MNSIPAQEIKRRGIAAVDEALRQGPVHIIKNNRPQYVVLTEERFQELLEIQASAVRANLRASLEDLKAGRVKRYEDVEALMRQLDRDDLLDIGAYDEVYR
jgi:PHD/YefM family antitoxin component YafN of YafNO toxin-antitoxin module